MEFQLTRWTILARFSFLSKLYLKHVANEINLGDWEKKRRKKTNLNFSLMNKMALRRVFRLDKLIFCNYRWVCEIGQVREAGTSIFGMPEENRTEISR